MTDMQTSLPLLIVWPSILNPVINFSTHLWPVKWNVLGYTFALRIPFHLLQCWCNICTNHITNDMIHFISSHDLVGSSTILTSLAFHRCLRPSVPSFAQASPPRCPSLQSLQVALHTCNQSVEPSHVLIFSTLFTWLNVISHMQWAPSSHVWALQHVQATSPPWAPFGLLKLGWNWLKNTVLAKILWEKNIVSAEKRSRTSQI